MIIDWSTQDGLLVIILLSVLALRNIYGSTRVVALILGEITQPLLILGHLKLRLGYVNKMIYAGVPGTSSTRVRSDVCTNQFKIRFNFLALLVLILQSSNGPTTILNAYTPTAGFFKNVFHLLFGLFEFNVVFLQAKLLFLI